VATLRLIVEAQEQFKAARVVDLDGDGIGEFGVFRELVGTVALRTNSCGINTGGLALESPLLPPRFGHPSVRRAEVRRSGYIFKVFLPGLAGHAVEEHAYSPFDSLEGCDEAGAETDWCAYAWPVRRGTSGRRTFFVNQSGVVTQANDRAYFGTQKFDTHNAGAAFVAGEGWIRTITGTQALGTVGRDGNFWRVVE
jgi:hypothetical protein